MCLFQRSPCVITILNGLPFNMAASLGAKEISQQFITGYIYLPVSSNKIQVKNFSPPKLSDKKSRRKQDSKNRFCQAFISSWFLPVQQFCKSQESSRHFETVREIRLFQGVFFNGLQKDPAFCQNMKSSPFCWKTIHAFPLFWLMVPGTTAHS